MASDPSNNDTEFDLLKKITANTAEIAEGGGGGGGSGITSLTGDVTATGPGSAAATVGKIGGKTVTLDGNLTTSGAFPTTLTVTGATTITLPTTGTLLTASTFPGNPVVTSDIFDGTVTFTAGFEGSRLPVIADGTAISSWLDSTGNGNTAAQATSGNRPAYRTALNGINGMPVVAFSSTKSMATTTGASGLTGDFYMGAVVRFTNVSASGYQVIFGFGDELSGKRRLMVKGAPTTGGGHIANGIEFNGFGQDVYINSAASVVVNNVPYYIEITKSGSVIAIYINGVYITQGTRSFSTFSSAAIALAANNAGGETLQGDLGLVLVKNSVPTADQLAFIRGYVTTHYGIDVFGNGWTAVPYYNASGGLTPSSLSVDPATGALTLLGGRPFYVNGSLFFSSTGQQNSYIEMLNLASLNDANSSKELLLRSASPGGNVLSVQNTDSTGYSAHTFRDDTNHDQMAIGYGNTSEAAGPFAGYNYIECWNNTATPAGLRIMVDGNYGPIGSGVRLYQRTSWESDGTFKWWKLIPWGTTQVAGGSFDKDTGQINADNGIKVGGGTALSKIRRGTAVLVTGAVTVTDAAITANSEVYVGMKTPGGTVGAHFVSAKTASTNFVITSTSALDTSTVSYLIIEP